MKNQAAYTSKKCSNCHQEGVKAFLIQIENSDFTPTSSFEAARLLTPKDEPYTFTPFDRLDLADFEEYFQGNLQSYDVNKLRSIAKKILKNGITVFYSFMGKDYYFRKDKKFHTLFFPSGAGNFVCCTNCGFIGRDINGSLNIREHNYFTKKLAMIELWKNRKEIAPRKHIKKMQYHWKKLIQYIQDGLAFAMEDLMIQEEGRNQQLKYQTHAFRYYNLRRMIQKGNFYNGISLTAVINKMSPLFNIEKENKVDLFSTSIVEDEKIITAFLQWIFSSEDSYKKLAGKRIAKIIFNIMELPFDSKVTYSKINSKVKEFIKKIR